MIALKGLLYEELAAAVAALGFERYRTDQIVDWIYRKRATDSLDRARRPWRVAYTCASLAGQHAAVVAGLGITVLPKDMVPAGLRTLERRKRLPDLHDTEIALLSGRNLPPPARRLHEHIVRSLEEVRAA